MYIWKEEKLVLAFDYENGSQVEIAYLIAELMLLQYVYNWFG
jgi:hypothetical protein